MATWFHVNYNWNTWSSTWKNIRGVFRDLFWVGPFETMYPEGFYGVPVQKMDKSE